MLQAVGEPSVSPQAQRLRCKSLHDAWQAFPYGSFKTMSVDALWPGLSHKEIIKGIMHVSAG